MCGLESYANHDGSKAYGMVFPDAPKGTIGGNSKFPQTSREAGSEDPQSPLPNPGVWVGKEERLPASLDSTQPGKRRVVQRPPRGKRTLPSHETNASSAGGRRG